MTGGTERRWLLLIHQLPPKPAYLRVKVWRRLQGLGAVAIKSSVYLMPKTDPATEDFQWMAREIAKDGGEAAICTAGFIEGLSDAQVESLFHAARDADYRQVADEAKSILGSTAGRSGKARADAAAALEAEFNRLQKRLAAVTAIDFFNAPGRSTAEAAMLQLQSRLGQSKAQPARSAKGTMLDIAAFKGRTWVTRQGVFVDRIACMWLIRRFIDPAAAFRFVAGKQHKPGAKEVRFDMFEGEFTHEGDRCSFEVFLDRFLPKDRALAEIGKIVHDLDLKDARFGLPEAAGFGSLLSGVASAYTSDEDRLAAGGALFDHLYAFFNSTTKNAGRRG
jgi:hypothetical protein